MTDPLAEVSPPPNVSLPQRGAEVSPSSAIDPRALDSAAFVEAMHRRGAARGAALAAYRAWHRINDPAPLAALGLAVPPLGRIARTEIEGLTAKFALSLGDGLESESVSIPMRKRSGGFSRTLCVSSQVGCAMGCRFCETAQMGLLRNLSTAEIVEQWRVARFLLPSIAGPSDLSADATGHAIRNIVFMGMGEPMENLDAVLSAIRVLCDRNGPGLAASRIAVSTVGRIGGIRRLGAFMQETGFRGIGLAISVNAPNDEVRDRIMPINRAEPIDALFEAIRAFPKRPSAALCIEYVLIPGVNDRLEDCDELCERLRGLKCSLNVIPYNPRRDSPWPAPDEASVEAFVARAVANGQFVKRRGTKGRDVMAACGQLGNPEIRRRHRVAAARGVDDQVRSEPRA